MSADADGWDGENGSNFARGGGGFFDRRKRGLDQTLNPESYTPNPTYFILNLKFPTYTPNPEPQTPNPKP